MEDNIYSMEDNYPAALQKLVAANPVAATLVFQATVENVVKQIININPARKDEPSDLRQR